MVFVHDQLFDRTKSHALTIVGTPRRVSPAVDVRQSYRGKDVVDTLERGVSEFGYCKSTTGAVLPFERLRKRRTDAKPTDRVFQISHRELHLCCRASQNRSNYGIDTGLVKAAIPG